MENNGILTNLKLYLSYLSICCTTLSWGGVSHPRASVTCQENSLLLTSVAHYFTFQWFEFPYFSIESENVWHYPYLFQLLKINSLLYYCFPRWCMRVTLSDAFLISLRCSKALEHQSLQAEQRYSISILLG